MNQTEVLDVLKRTGALMEGHFKLSSGRHSDTYVQKQMVFQHPRLTASLGEAVAERFDKSGHTFDTVLSPAVGAILFGNAVAYAAGARFVYAERADGAMTLRRAQALDPGERVLVVEDVVTTGGSAAEVNALRDPTHWGGPNLVYGGGVWYKCGLWAFSSRKSGSREAPSQSVWA